MVVIKTKKDLMKFAKEYKRKKRLKLQFCDCIFQSLEEKDYSEYKQRRNLK